MTTLIATPVKTITYDRLTGDYKMYLNGEFVGYAACYHVAEVELDRLAYEQLDRAGVEPELLQTATVLDGGSGQDEIAAEYAAALPVQHAPTMGDEIWDYEPQPPAPVYSKLLCKRCGQITTHIKYAKSPFPICCPCRAEDDQRDWDEAHQFATGHNLITPDPVECPDVSAPQPVEDLPTYFILPSGITMQSIILCIGGVSRVVSAQGVAEALALASVHQVKR